MLIVYDYWKTVQFVNPLVRDSLQNEPLSKTKSTSPVFTILIVFKICTSKRYKKKTQLFNAKIIYLSNICIPHTLWNDPTNKWIHFVYCPLLSFLLYDNKTSCREVNLPSGWAESFCWLSLVQWLVVYWGDCNILLLMHAGT